MSAFDAHRSGGVCRDPETLTRKDGNPTLMVVERLSGPIWIKWISEEKRNRQWWKELEEV